MLTLEKLSNSYRNLIALLTPQLIITFVLTIVPYYKNFPQAVSGYLMIIQIVLWFANISGIMKNIYRSRRYIQEQKELSVENKKEIKKKVDIRRVKQIIWTLTLLVISILCFSTVSWIYSFLTFLGILELFPFSIFVILFFEVRKLAISQNK